MDDKLLSLSFNGLGHSQELLLSLNSLRANQELCDVTLQVGCSSIRAHRVVLSASSPYFRAMFTGGLAESTQDVIAMQDVSKQAFSDIVDYFYTSKIDINGHNVQDLLATAGLLQVPHVANACCEFLKRQMSAENCLGIASFADAHSCNNLVQTATSYAQNHFVDIVQQDEFMLISSGHLLRIISDDNLNVHTEERVFEAVLSWINYDYETRKEYSPELFSRVRFPLMTPEFLLNRVANENVIRSSSACLDLFMEAMSTIVLQKDKGCLPSQQRLSPRRNISAQCVLYAIGGMGRRVPMKIGERYDPRDGKWKTIADMNECRWSAGIAAIGPYLYICGGSDDASRVNTMERYDPFSNVWLPLAPMTSNRNGVGLAACAGKIYAAGGFDGSNPLNTAEVFDPKSGKWSAIPSMRFSRFGLGCCVLGDHIYAVGGSDGATLRSVERYDPATNQWALVAQMNTARKQVGCIAVGGFIYAVGGCDHTVRCYNTAERYDPALNVWSEIAPMSSARSGCGVAELDGFVFVVGGYNGTSYLNSVERYDPLTNQWHPSTSMGHARECVAVCVATTKRQKRLAETSRSPSPPVVRTSSNPLTSGVPALLQLPPQ